MTFNSIYEERGNIVLPEFSGIRIMMMPLILGDIKSVPTFLATWIDAIQNLFEMAREHAEKIGYLTIDEKRVKAGESHRRPGLHVDGVCYKGSGAWGGGGGWGGGAKDSTGMLTVSNIKGCRVWQGQFDGWPGPEGECDHLTSQCFDPITLKSYTVYWLHGLCIHESIPVQYNVRRQFVRLSLPSDSPWFEGYTVNPLGIKPTGPILPQRIFMDN
mgnify:CR=1 FL=1